MLAWWMPPFLAMHAHGGLVGSVLQHYMYVLGCTVHACNACACCCCWLCVQDISIDVYGRKTAEEAKAAAAGSIACQQAEKQDAEDELDALLTA